MRSALFYKTLKKVFSPFSGGEKGLFVFCVLFLLCITNLFFNSTVEHQPVLPENGDFVSAVQLPDMPESALCGKPLRSIERLIRNTRQGHCVRLPKTRMAALLPVPVDLAGISYGKLPAELAFSVLLLQKGILSSVLVRAGPFCPEAFFTAFQKRQNDLKEFYDERIFQEKYGIHHLLRLLCNSCDCRNLCLQDDFLRS